MTMTSITSASCKKGYMQIRKCDEEKFRAEFMEMFGLRSRLSFYNRINGRTEPKLSEIQKISALFKKYGVTDIWGE